MLTPKSGDQTTWSPLFFYGVIKMKLSEHEADIIFRQHRLWATVSQDLRKFILDSIGNDPCLSDHTIKSISDLTRFDYCTIEWKLGCHFESVYLYVRGKESTYEVTGMSKTDTCTVVEIECELSWASTQRSITSAQAAIILYQRAINLAALIQTRYDGQYGFTKTF